MSRLISILILTLIFLRGNRAKLDLAECPYCQPDYMDVANLQSALKGYDLPLGDPDRIDDPGVKGQIFEGMIRNEKGLMEINGDFF